MRVLVLIFVTILPTVSAAQDNFLVGIPGVGNPSGDFDGYLQAVYAMFISIAALLAVVKIVIAGLKYMLTDIAPQKTSAKSDIQGALLGLLIVMSAVLILTVINPELTRFDFDANRVAAPDAPVFEDDERINPIVGRLESNGVYSYVSFNNSGGPGDNGARLSDMANMDAYCSDGEIQVTTNEVRCFEGIRSASEIQNYCTRSILSCSDEEITTERSRLDTACSDTGGNLVDVPGDTESGWCLIPN